MTERTAAAIETAIAAGADARTGRFDAFGAELEDLVRLSCIVSTVHNANAHFFAG